MTSRLLLSGVLAAPAVRRRRRADGAVFAIARVRDTDRGAKRDWTVFANDPALIERLEELRVGEPIAVSGPFAVILAGSEHEPRIEHRVTAEALVDTKRRRKPKGQIAKEERTESTEADQAPTGSDEGELNDALPW